MSRLRLISNQMHIAGMSATVAVQPVLPKDQDSFGSILAHEKPVKAATGGTPSSAFPPTADQMASNLSGAAENAIVALPLQPPGQEMAFLLSAFARTAQEKQPLAAADEPVPHVSTHAPDASKNQTQLISGGAPPSAGSSTLAPADGAPQPAPHSVEDDLRAASSSKALFVDQMSLSREAVMAAPAMPISNQIAQAIMQGAGPSVARSGLPLSARAADASTPFVTKAEKDVAVEGTQEPETVSSRRNSTVRAEAAAAQGPVAAHETANAAPDFQAAPPSTQSRPQDVNGTKLPEKIPDAALPSGKQPGGDALVINLTPETLGSVQVRLRMLGGALNVQISASQQETVAGIRSSKEELAQTLETAGYRIDGIAVRSLPPDIAAQRIETSGDAPSTAHLLAMDANSGRQDGQGHRQPEYDQHREPQSKESASQNAQGRLENNLLSAGRAGSLFL